MKQALRVLFIAQTYPRFEGDTAGPFIRDLARGLARLGDRVTVLVPHAEGVPDRWEDQGVEAVSFRYAPRRMEVVGYSRTLESDERIKAAAAWAAPFYAAGLLRAVRRQLRSCPFDLVHAHWIVPNGILAAAFDSVPLAIGLHGSDVFLAERTGVRRAAGWALRRSRLLTGCSPELVDRVCALGFPAERARVIPYGVDVGAYSPVCSPDRGRRHAWRERLGIPGGAPLLLSVGRMATKKGFHVLMEALPDLLAEVPEAHVVLAGGGDLLPALQAQAKRFPGRLHLPGSVLRDILPDLYRAADVFVLPAVHDSKGNVDGLPNVILEAMASGLPVVASGISGIPLAVADGVTGLLVPERDAAALKRALRNLLTERGRAKRMGDLGREKAERELTWDAVAARYHEGYVAALSMPT